MELEQVLVDGRLVSYIYLLIVNVQEMDMGPYVSSVHFTINGAVAAAKSEENAVKEPSLIDGSMTVPVHYTKTSYPGEPHEYTEYRSAWVERVPVQP